MAKKITKPATAPAIAATPVETRDTLRRFATLGRNYRKAKHAVAQELKALANETNEAIARDWFYVGTLADALFPDLPELEGEAKAQGVLEQAPFNANGEPSRDGRVRRTQEQERAYGNARQAWLEIRRAAGINKVSDAGGANNPNGNKPKADKPEAVTSDAGKAEKAEPVKTPEVVKVTETKQAAPIVREFRVRWAAFMTQASKLEDFPIEAGDVAAQITGLMNKLETLLAK